MFLKWGYYLLINSFFFFMLFIYMIYMYEVIVIEVVLLNLLSLDVKMYFLLDWISLSFMFVVMMISGMVVIYSHEYMEGESEKFYFCYMVLLFVFSMLLLIISPNMMMIILGWDGLGLVSYCLVVFYQSTNSYNSGMITVLMNRIGDVTLMMSVIFLLNYGSLDMGSVKEMIKICGILIMISGMTKSAQIPFSAWLPAAMAAPTPVSSLVHSSTLVTAGIYLLIRFSILFEVKFYSSIMMILSSMTMFMAGVGANLELDFKKIIAFSTLSQLGMIMLILSLGKMELAFFHLLMHALFKSMLFLCAGLVIHTFSGVQDIRYLGGFFSFSPLISGCMGLASLSLFGFPFVGGFYSKDLILEFIYMNINNMFIIMIVIASTSLTMIYCMRMLYYIVWKGIFIQSFFLKGSNFFMLFPIYFLSFMVIILGNMFSWMNLTYEDLLILSNLSKFFNLILILISFYFFYLMFIVKMEGYMMKNMYYFFSSMWFMSILSSMILLKKFKKFSMILENDWKWTEEMGPGGVFNFFKNNSYYSVWLSNNFLSSLVLLYVSMLIMYMYL
uniref:NADH-ubiquinone oxidoreductase chain 5 n=1 Tax=Ixodes nipponensis TaxID=63660 RepID=A0A8E5NJA4_9ACAR|nr:NADH dehydrogenase subunit 5 [Ixodes nipponensis]YP_010324827.1 NADH dehydrogenase subunit 5 [Ixodes sinensis]QVD40445.1 NADH dehydrogenase subunit 5 [Ixodes nipponensis]UNO53605.1 NADH dehydrogenase subunit 5 [Ixodes sinensis]UNO53683.1 NADH dehydrogenase subunit 5 [Ixodes sinensis]